MQPSGLQDGEAAQLRQDAHPVLLIAVELQRSRTGEPTLKVKPQVQMSLLLFPHLLLSCFNQRPASILKPIQYVRRNIDSVAWSVPASPGPGQHDLLCLAVRVPVGAALVRVDGAREGDVVDVAVGLV